MADYLLYRPSGYYFRYIIPKRFEHVAPVKELRYSLKTSRLPDAERSVRRAVVTAERLLSEAARRSSELSIDYIKNRIRQAINGTPDAPVVSDNVDLTHTLTIFLKSLNIDVDTCSEEFISARLAAFQELTPILDTQAPVNELLPNSTEANDGPQLSEVIESYCSEKRKSDSWIPKSEAQVAASLKQLLYILSDLPMAAISSVHARQWKDTLLKLPPNMSKFPQYQGMTPIEVADTNQGDTLSITTFNNIHNRINGFWKWTYQQGHINRNYFDGLKVKEPKRAKDKRAAFTDEDLTKLFTTEQYQQHQYKHPHYYWVPLIGLHTGARLEEICQLYLDDVKQVEDVWCFSIGNSRDDQKTKTDASNRVTPIHSKLLELRLLDYVESLKQQGAERLFPELRRQRDGYSTSVSKWFGRYRNKLGMKNLTPKKDFHSFRHTLATRMKQADIPESVAGAIVGHTTGDGITYGRYGKDYLVEQVQKAVESVTFDDSLVAVNTYKEI